MAKTPSAKTPKEKVKMDFDKKAIRRLVIVAAITAVTYQIESVLRYYAYPRPGAEGTELPALMPNLRYPHQAAFLFLIVMVILLVRAILKAIPKSIKKALFAQLSVLYEKASKTALGKALAKLRAMLGLDFENDERKRVRGDGNDEKSFIFDLENGLFRRFASKGEQMKWKDLQTNAERIRFLYIKYIGKLVKSGYAFKMTRTPSEIAKEAKLEGDPKRLFELYVDARYALDTSHITDQDVETSNELIKKRGLR